jgi:hypothetical protein
LLNFHEFSLTHSEDFAMFILAHIRHFILQIRINRRKIGL